MDKRLQRCLAGFHPNREQTVRLMRAGGETLELSFCTDERPERGDRAPSQIELPASESPGPLHRVRSSSWEFRAFLGRSRLAVELEVTLMRYPAFDNLAQDPERLLQLAEYHDFLHQVVASSYHVSRRGLGLGFTTLGDRPWLRFFHLVADINARHFPAVGPVAHRDPGQVDWAHPVETDIDMHWLTPVAEDCVFALRVFTRLYKCQQVETVSPATVRSLGDAVAVTLTARPAIDLSALIERSWQNEGGAGDEQTFQWPAQGYLSAPDMPLLFETEEWAPFFAPAPGFDITDPRGSMTRVSPQQVLNTELSEVQSDLAHQKQIAQRWQVILDQLNVGPQHFLQDTEHLIVRGR